MINVMLTSFQEFTPLPSSGDFWHSILIVSIKTLNNLAMWRPLRCVDEKEQ
jgi:hypothetical protein